MKKILIAAIALAFVACGKNDSKLNEESKAIIAKWKVDSASWVYTDFNGIEGSFSRIYSTSTYFNYWEFKNDRSLHATLWSNGSESVDYSPSGWTLNDKILRIVSPTEPEQVTKYNIKEINSNSLIIEYTDYSSTDTINDGTQAFGIGKRYMSYFSK